VEGPVTVAVTGPFASGKSTLVRFLGELPGTQTASADEIVHHLLKNDHRTISRIIERFGEGVRGPDGIDRKALGREVFGDAGALRDLEEILHPLVRSETDRRIEASRVQVFVVEIPLLFETGLHGGRHGAGREAPCVGCGAGLGRGGAAGRGGTTALG
jgi:dephospho-CoA kinase